MKPICERPPLARGAHSWQVRIPPPRENTCASRTSAAGLQTFPQEMPHQIRSRGLMNASSKATEGIARPVFDCASGWFFAFTLMHVVLACLSQRLVVAFIGNAAGDTPLGPQARSGGSNFKEGCCRGGAMPVFPPPGAPGGEPNTVDRRRTEPVPVRRGRLRRERRYFCNELSVLALVPPDREFGFWVWCCLCIFADCARCSDGPVVYSSAPFICRFTGGHCRCDRLGDKQTECNGNRENSHGLLSG